MSTTSDEVFGVAVILYMLVAVSVVSVLSPTELKGIREAEGAALLEVVHKGSPDFPIDRIFPFLAVFAVANTALINMLMASRLIYGMARQDVLPRPLGRVLPGRRTPWAGIAFSTILALGLIWYVTSDPDSNIVANLSGTTAFLLLCVFTVVNVACVVLRGQRDHNRQVFFTSPGPLPIVAAVLCAFLAGPWVDRDAIQYQIAGGADGDRRRPVAHHPLDQQDDQHRAGRTGRHAEHRPGRSCPAAATSQPLTSCRRPQPEMVPKNAAGESVWKPQPRQRTPTRRLSGVGVAGTGAGIDCGGKQPIEAVGPVLWRDYGKDRAPFPGRVFLGC
jgi:hypothetical protein